MYAARRCCIVRDSVITCRIIAHDVHHPIVIATRGSALALAQAN